MAVRTVSPGGSINAAISMSGPGDFVEVRGPGSHTGGIRVDRPGVTVIGENPDVRVGGQLYATAGGRGSRVTGLYLFNGGNGARVNPAIDASGFSLDHCTIDNEHSSIAVHIGAAGTQAADVVVEHNRIIHVGREPWTNYDHGIYFRNTLRAIARHNVFEDGGDYALHFWGPAIDTLIEYNLVRDGWAGAVILGGNSGGWSRGTRIRRNIFLGPPRSGRTVVYEYWEGVSTANIAAADNLVEDNIVFGGARFPSAPRGFVQRANLDLDPVLVDGVITTQAAVGYGPAAIQPGGSPPPPPPPSGDCSAYIAERDAAIAERDQARADADAYRQIAEHRGELVEQAEAARDQARDELAALEGMVAETLPLLRGDLTAIRNRLARVEEYRNLTDQQRMNIVQARNRAQIALDRLPEGPPAA